MKPNKEELQAVYNANLIIRKKLPEYSMFGDANWEKLDRQNEIIQQAIDGKLIFADPQNDNDIDYEVNFWIEEGDDQSEYGITTLEEVEEQS